MPFDEPTVDPPKPKPKKRELNMRNKYTQYTGKLPTDKELRKRMPIGTGVLDYFPDALAAVAYVSYVGNQQHNPGQPLHWARGKSTDQEDCVIRHFMERETFDDDKCRHSAKLVWRALANLQLEIEEARSKGEPGICAEDVTETSKVMSGPVFNPQTPTMPHWDPRLGDPRVGVSVGSNDSYNSK
jgi:hypothetical protein